MLIWIPSEGYQDGIRPSRNSLEKMMFRKNVKQARKHEEWPWNIIQFEPHAREREGGEGANAVCYNTILVIVTSDRDFWSQGRSKRCDTSPKDRSALLSVSGLSHWWEQRVGSTTFVQTREQISAVDSMGNLTGAFSWLPYCFTVAAFFFFFFFFFFSGVL